MKVMQLKEKGLNSSKYIQREIKIVKSVEHVRPKNLNLIIVIVPNNFLLLCYRRQS
jgi:hypothetical protein